jgi:hypothetical protein
MIDPVRREILLELTRLSELAPDLRFGQMIANLAFLAAGPWNETLWDLEDDTLLQAIREQLQTMQQPKPSRPLREVMDEIGANAEKRGLTPEILNSLLRDE